MRGSFIRISSCYAPIARRASYASPAQFPGVTLARGTGARTTTWKQHRNGSECLVHSLISYDALCKTRWCKRDGGEHSLQMGLATEDVKDETGVALQGNRTRTNAGKNGMNVGLFGGSFDPIHRGHLALALAAAERYSLRQVLFVPANIPPHKQKHPLTAFIHRYAMVALATQDEKRFVPSLLEAPEFATTHVGTAAPGRPAV